RRAVARPFQENALMYFKGLDRHPNGELINLPLPLDLFALFQPATASGKPELGGNVRIDKRLKDLCKWSADQHGRFWRWGLSELKGVDACFSFDRWVDAYRERWPDSSSSRNFFNCCKRSSHCLPMASIQALAVWREVGSNRYCFSRPLVWACTSLAWDSRS